MIFCVHPKKLVLYHYVYPHIVKLWHKLYLWSLYSSCYTRWYYWRGERRTAIRNMTNGTALCTFVFLFFFCKARVICLGYYGALQLVKLVVVSFNLSTKLTSRAPHHPHLHCIECTFAQFSRIYNKGMTECSIQQSDMIYSRVIKFVIQNQIWFYSLKQYSLDKICNHSKNINEMFQKSIFLYLMFSFSVDGCSMFIWCIFR